MLIIWQMTGSLCLIVTTALSVFVMEICTTLIFKIEAIFCPLNCGHRVTLTGGFDFQHGVSD